MPIFDASYLIDARRNPSWGRPIMEHALDIGEPLLVPVQAAIEYATGTEEGACGVTELDSSLRIVPCDEAIGREASQLAQDALGDAVLPGWADIQIAATARHHGLSVVTTNPLHFEDLHVGVWNLPDVPSGGWAPGASAIPIPRKTPSLAGRSPVPTSVNLASGTELELARGDIARQADLEAVVNAANARLMPGGGVAGAIHRAAGDELAKACRPLAPIEPGEAVVTDAFELPNDHVIHALGPVYGEDEPADELLASCYERSLELCGEHGIASVGFPALSTGAFGYPTGEAAEVALSTVRDAAPDVDTLGLVRFVLWGADSYEAHREVLEGLED